MRALFRPLLVLALPLAAAGLPAFAQTAGDSADAPTVEAVTAPAPAAVERRQGPVTGFPLPRHASVRAGEARMRTGPGFRYPTEWLYRLPGMPVRIVEEFEAWRKVRAWDGTEGWMHKSLLTGTRTAMVTDDGVLLRRDPAPDAAPLARLGRGLLAELATCREGWCAVSAQGFDGWVPRGAVWGLLEGETFAE